MTNQLPAHTTSARPPRGANSTYPGTPRWVKLSGLVALCLILLVVVIMLLGGGEHGPLRHIPSGSGVDSPLLIAVGSYRA